MPVARAARAAIAAADDAIRPLLAARAVSHLRRHAILVHRLARRVNPPGELQSARQLLHPYQQRTAALDRLHMPLLSRHRALRRLMRAMPLARLAAIPAASAGSAARTATAAGAPAAAAQTTTTACIPAATTAAATRPLTTTANLGHQPASSAAKPRAVVATVAAHAAAGTALATAAAYAAARSGVPV